MLSRIREHFHNNKTILNIFLIYFFLTFVIGYIDFDRRVNTFETSTEYLKRVVMNNFNPPMNHRILIPYSVYFFHKATHIPLAHSYALFRFLFYFLAFALFHKYLRKWFSDELAMIGTLSLIASLPLTLTNWYAIPTDMPELITFILGAMWIRDNKFKPLLFLIPIASLNRETTLALVLLYFLNGIGKEKTNILIKRTTICFLLWLIPSAVLISLFGGIRKTPSFFYNIGYNVQGLLAMFKSPNPYNHYYFVLYLCGFYWFLAFQNFRNKDNFLKKSVIFMALYFVYAFLRAGGINEVRIFIPFYVFVIPLGLFSLFPKKGRAE